MKKVIKILKKLLHIWCKTSLILIYIFAIPMVLFMLLTLMQIGYSEHVNQECRKQCYNRDEEKESACFKLCYDTMM